MLTILTLMLVQRLQHELLRAVCFPFVIGVNVVVGSLPVLTSCSTGLLGSETLYKHAPRESVRVGELGKCCNLLWDNICYWLQKCIFGL